MLGRTGIIIIGLLIIASLSGCSKNSNNIGISGNESLLVTVTDNSGNKVQGLAIVLGDSSGAMKAYGETDSNGQITFTDAPADATVTAATSCLYSGGTKTSYSLHVEYDVNTQINISAGTCPVSPPRSGELGTVTLSVTNTLSEVTHNQIVTIGRTFAEETTLISQETVTVTSYDLQGDGKLSIIVLGKDANDKTIGYGALLGQTFTNQMPVNITVDHPISYAQYDITNIPNTAKKLYATLDLFCTGKGLILFNDAYSLSSGLSSTTLNIPYIPGIGDRVTYGLTAYLDQDQDGLVDSSQKLYLAETLVNTPSDQNFDLGNALTAPSQLRIIGSNTPTPTLTWSGVAPGATSVTVGPMAKILSMNSSWSLSIGNLSNSRTSITLPELPDSLSAFRPNGLYHFSVNTSASGAGMSKISIGGYPSLSVP